VIFDLVAVSLQQAQLRSFSKPGIVLILMAFLLSCVRTGSLMRTLILMALLFSWLGDILLMFTDRDPVFFLLGLGAFLLAHIFYIVFFNRVKERESIKPRWWLLIMVAFYYISLLTLLLPGLEDDMKIPVPVYGLVISFMLLLALHMPYGIHKTAGKLMAIGAMLFVISDSVLAIDRFYQSFEYASFIIMLCYSLAQFFLVLGSTKYIRDWKAPLNREQ
jgi:uncharacterized membrane protein YhhN